MTGEIDDDLFFKTVFQKKKIFPDSVLEVEAQKFFKKIGLFSLKKFFPFPDQSSNNLRLVYIENGTTMKIFVKSFSG